MTSVAKENLPVWRGSTFRKKIIKKEQKVYLTKWPLCREPVDQKLKDKMISKDESHLTYGMHLKCSPFQSANQRKTHNILYGKHQTLFLRLIFWITCCNLFPFSRKSWAVGSSRECLFSFTCLVSHNQICLRLCHQKFEQKHSKMKDVDVRTWSTLNWSRFRSCLS